MPGGNEGKIQVFTVQQVNNEESKATVQEVLALKDHLERW